MSKNKIKAYSTKMYPLIFSEESEAIKKLKIELLHAVKEFNLFISRSQPKWKASELICVNKETFDLLNDNFIKDIESIDDTIENEDSVSLTENFNNMVLNCGTCYKKFRN